MTSCGPKQKLAFNTQEIVCLWGIFCQDKGTEGAKMLTHFLGVRTHCCSNMEAYGYWLTLRSSPQVAKWRITVLPILSLSVYIFSRFFCGIICVSWLTSQRLKSQNPSIKFLHKHMYKWHYARACSIQILSLLSTYSPVWTKDLMSTLS